MAEQPEFDPRFHPAFQRGYEPPAQTTPKRPVRSEPRREEFVGPPPQAPAVPLVVAAPATKSAPASDQVHPIAGTPVAESRGINPYIVILWIVGAVLTLGGTALLFVGNFRAFTNNTDGPQEQLDAQRIYLLGTTFGGPLVTVGLVTIAGLLALSAWRAGHRRQNATS